MHIVPTKEGKLACYHCGHEFDEHPDETSRQRLHRQLCAIEDDDDAARAFHFHKAQQAIADQTTEVWIDRTGFYVPDTGSVRFEGIKINLEPGATTDDAMRAIEAWVLPSIKQSIVEALNGTQEHQDTAHIPMHKYDPSWYPCSPPMEDLYPNGYVRHPDGAVEAKKINV